ncbi:MAG TPA: hypothetical protein VIK11_09415 [Tepidiformaceae bacterium]
MRLDLLAIALRRCPRCRKGRSFHGPVAMNRECPTCALVFEREPATSRVTWLHIDNLFNPFPQLERGN